MGFLRDQVATMSNVNPSYSLLKPRFCCIAVSVQILTSPILQTWGTLSLSLWSFLEVSLALSKQLVDCFDDSSSAMRQHNIKPKWISCHIRSYHLFMNITLIDVQEQCLQSAVILQTLVCILALGMKDNCRGSFWSAGCRGNRSLTDASCFIQRSSKEFMQPSLKSHKATAFSWFGIQCAWRTNCTANVFPRFWTLAVYRRSNVEIINWVLVVLTYQRTSFVILHI